MLSYITIGDGERGLMFRDGAFKKVLEPGIHAILHDPWDVRVEVVSVFDYQVVYKDLEKAVANFNCDNEFIVFERDDGQSGSSRNGKKFMERENTASCA